MKIKRLELNGFKSFSEKTIIPFPKGISGVVGPNGCGKSNIVDAIKWVMGEQSPKQLRGKGMEDVIFSGSNSKSSVGMAEVTLVMENDNGHLPSEFSGIPEVMVTRRLYRDGESEYIINNKPCRLKDITHLFLDTGVGNKAYAVIEQGKVGAIIDSKPEERRHWIEEAAGISKYKSRKHETLRKLELTQQNLLRVGDVIAEVKRQMNSLYRQAKKAERFREIRQQLKEVEMVLLAREYQDLVQEKETKGQALSLQTQKVQGARNESRTLQETLEQLQAQVSELERKLKQEQERFYLQKATWQRQDDLNHQFRRELEQLSQALLDYQREKADIEVWLTEKALEEKKLGAERDSYAETLSREETRIAELEQTVTTAKAELNRNTEGYEQVKDRLVTKLTDQTKVRNQRAGILKVREERRRRTLRQAEEKNQLVDRLNHIGQLIQSAEAEKKQDLALIGEKTAEIERIREMRIQKETDLKTLEGMINELEQRLHQDQVQIENLQEIRQSYQSYQNGVRSLMQGPWHQETEGADELASLLAYELEAEPGYEAAVEAALGETLQGILVKEPRQALKGIQVLKSGNQGKATFLALSGLVMQDEGEEMPAQEGWDLLISKVTAREEILPAIRLLLGRFVLAPDLEQGLRIWHSNPGRISVVTPEGDIIQRQGLIAGGSAGSQESGILFQKNTIRRLKEKGADWQEKIRTKQDEKAVLEKDRQDLEAAEREAESQKKDRENALVEVEKLLFGYQEETKPLQNRLRILSFEEAEILAQEEEDTQEEQSLSHQEARLDQEVGRLREEIQARDKEITAQQEDLEQSRETLVQAQTQFSALGEKGEYIAKEWLRLQEALQERRERKEKVLDKMKQGEQTLSELQERLVSGEKAVRVYLQEVTQLEQTIREWEQVLAERFHEREEKEGALKALKAEIEEREQLENALKIEATQIAMRLEHLEEQALEKASKSVEEILKSHGDQEADPEQLREKKREFREKIDQMGEVNLTAIEEYNAFKERYEFYRTQEGDLLASMDSLKRAIQKINATSEELFVATFKTVQEKFNEVFPILFAGGTAKLSLTDDDDPLESGVEILVQPPGKRLTNMSLLSGGEKALTALALLFSIYLVKPSPFCLLDEIDAFLDEANVERFKNLVQGLVRDSQIILITHNRRVMEMADTLYGVTMEQPGISKLISVQLDTLN